MTQNSTRKPIPSSPGRQLTSREVALLKPRMPRASRRWYVYRDQAGRVIVARPVGGQCYETFSARELDQ